MSWWVFAKTVQDWKIQTLARLPPLLPTVFHWRGSTGHLFLANFYQLDDASFNSRSSAWKAMKVIKALTQVQSCGSSNTTTLEKRMGKIWWQKWGGSCSQMQLSPSTCFLGLHLGSLVLQALLSSCGSWDMIWSVFALDLNTNDKVVYFTGEGWRSSFPWGLWLSSWQKENLQSTRSWFPSERWLDHSHWRPNHCDGGWAEASV